MTWLFGVLVLLVIGAAVVVASGRGGELADADSDRGGPTLPAGRPLRSTDLERVRFSTSVRGYTTDEVDWLLERLGEELDRRPAGEGPSTS